MHVAVPQPGQQRLAAAIENFRAGGHLDCIRRALARRSVPCPRSRSDSAMNIFASASKVRTFVNATVPAGFFTSALASAGACGRQRRVCASVRRCVFAGVLLRQPAQEEHEAEELVVGVRPDRDRRAADAVLAQAVTSSCCAAPAPTSRVVSFSARALPPGSRFMVWSGLASRRSSSHAVCRSDRRAWNRTPAPRRPRCPHPPGSSSSPCRR